MNAVTYYWLLLSLKIFSTPNLAMADEMQYLPDIGTVSSVNSVVNLRSMISVFHLHHMFS